MKNIDFSSPALRRKLVEHMLSIQSTVFLHVDPRTSGTIVPSRLRLQPQVVLQVGTNMPVPIPDLRVDDEGVYGTLSFKGVPFTVWLPWKAIFAVVGEDGKGAVFQEPPAELLAQANLPHGVTSLSTERDKRKDERKPQVFHKKSTTPAVRPPYLRLVK